MDDLRDFSLPCSLFFGDVKRVCGSLILSVGTGEEIGFSLVYPLQVF